MTRRAVALMAMGLLVALVALDLLRSDLNPYAAPAVLALGSGAAPTGGFCGAPPK